jgi:GNAT superfamily N-acetyltransferase
VDAPALPKIRPAGPDDAGEVLRLAYVMWEDMGIGGRPGEWEVDYQQIFAEEIAGPRLHVAVAEHPDEPQRLIACGAAWTYRLLPSFWLTNGSMGYLQWFYTDRPWRRRGIATAVLDDCIAWLRVQGCTRIQLHSSPAAEALYDKIGFEPTSFKNLWLRVPPLERAE